MLLEHHQKLVPSRALARCRLPAFVCMQVDSGTTLRSPENQADTVRNAQAVLGAVCISSLFLSSCPCRLYVVPDSMLLLNSLLVWCICLQMQLRKAPKWKVATFLLDLLTSHISRYTLVFGAERVSYWLQILDVRVEIVRSTRGVYFQGLWVPSQYLALFNNWIQCGS